MPDVPDDNSINITFAPGSLTAEGVTAPTQATIPDDDGGLLPVQPVTGGATIAHDYSTRGAYNPALGNYGVGGGGGGEGENYWEDSSGLGYAGQQHAIAVSRAMQETAGSVGPLQAPAVGGRARVIRTTNAAQPVGGAGGAQRQTVRPRPTGPTTYSGHSVGGGLEAPGGITELMFWGNAINHVRNLSDAGLVEERWGEWGADLIGLGIMASDIHNDVMSDHGGWFSPGWGGLTQPDRTPNPIQTSDYAGRGWDVINNWVSSSFGDGSWFRPPGSIGGSF